MFRNVHLFSKYFLRAFHVSGIVLSSRTMVLDSEVKVIQSCLLFTAHENLQSMGFSG